MLKDKIEKLFENQLDTPGFYRPGDQRSRIKPSQDGQDENYTVEFDYAVEDMDKNAIIKELRALGLKVIKVNMSGPGGDWPAVTAAGSKKTLELFLNSYDPDKATYSGVDEFIEVHEV